VIVVDIDEFLYHPDLGKVLKQYHTQEIECIDAYGYCMVADQFPESDNTQPLYNHLYMGLHDPAYNKTFIFDPRTIDIQYDVGTNAKSIA
jgi:hypothetical protein